MRHVRWLLCLVTLALVPVVGRAQPQVKHDTTVVRRAGYAGTEACIDCHKKAVASFAATSMGKLFLEHPRNDREKLGCESCHGPSKQHAESGGEERGEMISFSGKAPSSVATRNATCLSCHDKTARAL